MLKSYTEIVLNITIGLLCSCLALGIFGFLTNNLTLIVLSIGVVTTNLVIVKFVPEDKIVQESGKNC